MEIERAVLFIDQQNGAPNGWVLRTYVRRNDGTAYPHDNSIGPSTDDDGIEGIEDLPEPDEAVEMVLEDFDQISEDDIEVDDSY